MKITQYWLVVATCQKDIIDKVNNMINQGWKPLGGISIRPYMIGDAWTYAQAIVKYEESISYDSKGEEI